MTYQNLKRHMDMQFASGTRSLFYFISAFYILACIICFATLDVHSLFYVGIASVIEGWYLLRYLLLKREVYLVLPIFNSRPRIRTIKSSLSAKDKEDVVLELVNAIQDVGTREMNKRWSMKPSVNPEEIKRLADYENQCYEVTFNTKWSSARVSITSDGSGYYYCIDRDVERNNRTIVNYATMDANKMIKKYLAAKENK